MEFDKDLQEIKKDLHNEQPIEAPIKAEDEIEIETDDKELVEVNKIEDTEKTNVPAVKSQDKFEMQTKNNNFVEAMTDNSVAIDIAREKYNTLKNQKKIGKQIEDVVKKNTETEIKSAEIKVQEKDKNNKVKQAEIKNELLRLENERIYLKKERKHKLDMQRAQHIRDNYEDLLLRTCRKKQKDANGKWVYVKDKDGNDIINVPGRFKLFWLRLFDGIISTLNQTADIFGALNKNVLKGGFILLVFALLFIPPFREWLIGLIGIKLG